MNFYLDKVLEKDKDILYRLLQYSLFEESLTDLNEMNEEALYEYKWFDNYFLDKDREAFFIKAKESNKLLGFVMINTYVQKVSSGHSIAEFMVIPKYRRNKIGKRVAIEVFAMYKGYWEVAPSFGNEVAYKFWKKVIEEYGNDVKFLDGIFVFKNDD